MSDWKEVPLGELVDLFDHKRVPLSSKQRSDRRGPYPYYGAQGVIDHIDDFIFDGRFILIPEDGENLRSRKLPIAYFADGQFWVNNHAHIAKAKPGIAVDRFVQGALEATDIGPFVTGAAQPKLSQANLRQIPLRVPPVERQITIASILDAVDDLIENNRRRVDLLEGMARAIYREWFVRFRYPGHEDLPLVDSPLGPIPDGWAAGTVGDVLTLQRGFDLPTRSRTEGSVPIISASGVGGSHNQAKVLGPGVVTGRSGTVGAVFYVPSSYWPLNTALWVKDFQRSSPLHAWFFLQALDLRRFAGGAAVPTLNRNVVHAEQVAVPPVELVERFDRAVEPMMDEAQILRRASGVQTTIRDVLLPKLVTGQIDVSHLDLEALAEAATA